MTESSAAVSALAADQTPAAAPVDPTVAAEASSSETVVADKGSEKPKRTRTSVRGLRGVIAHMEQINKDLKENNDRLYTRLVDSRSDRETTEERLEEAHSKLRTSERSLVSARAALEFVIAILAADKSPAELVAFLPQKATEFGIDLRVINDEVIAGLDKAYAKATQRALKAAETKAVAELKERMSAIMKRGPGGVTAVSGSGLESLMATLLAIGVGEGSFDELEDPMAAIFGNRR